MAEFNQINEYKQTFKFEWTWPFKAFIRLPHKIIGLFYGNQAGKTSGVTYSYVLRIHGMHPVPQKNFFWFKCPECKQKWNVDVKPKDNICPNCNEMVILQESESRIVRFGSEVLPFEKRSTGEGGQSKEIKNTVYPEFKKWLPQHLITQDLTFRNPSMSITDPWSGFEFGKDLYYKGGEVVVEFISYGQKTQSQAGVQRKSIYLDEEAPYPTYEEQIPRLLATGGDLILGCTPANRLSYLYDEVFERAQLYIRSPAIVDAYQEIMGEKIEQTERTNNPASIAVIQAATDDNPTLKTSNIEAILGGMADPDAYVTRRYGLFRQTSNRIFKAFKRDVHVVKMEDWFPDGKIHWNWRHAILIDYHSHNPWAISFVSLSPYDEMFEWWEMSPDPERFVTRQIATHIAGKMGDYKWYLALIDPLAENTQNNTGTTVIADLNSLMIEFRNEGLCAGAVFQTWNTKGTEGRERMRTRLANSVECGKPFNNRYTDNHGHTKYKPTFWVSHKCRDSIKSLANWSLEQWADNIQLVTKDRKEVPAQKNSHFCTALEAVLKEGAWLPPRIPRPGDRIPQRRRSWASHYMRP